MSEAPPYTPSTERIAALDVLRGFALFGVIVMNIPAMGLPEAAAFNPAALGAPSPSALAAWIGASLAFEGGMRALFSMLFGAGFLLFLERQERRGEAGVRLFLRRAALLIGFGLFDRIVLLWTGDILLPYGLAAFALLLFRRARIAIVVAAMAALILVPMIAAPIEANAFADLERRAETSEAARLEWRAATAFWSPSPEEIAADVARARQGWAAVAAHEAAQTFSPTGAAYVGTVAVDALLGMLAGLLAYRAGLIQGRWGARPLALLGAGAWIVALAVNGYETASLIQSNFSFVAYVAAQSTYDLGRLALASAWLAVVLLAMRLPVFAAAARALADVGRLALSNYLAQSLLAAALFVGLGLFGALDRVSLYAVAAAIFAVNLAASRIWLARFSVGPAEWLWRRLTYGR